jgi:hypothetical protein
LGIRSAIAAPVLPSLSTELVETGQRYGVMGVCVGSEGVVVVLECA